MRYYRRHWILVTFLCFPITAITQPFRQIVYGRVVDSESHIAVQSASVVCETCKPARGTVTDSSGYYKMEVPVGRHIIMFSHLAYQPVLINDIQAGTGKAVNLNIVMHERVFQTGDVSVKGSTNRWINPMASVSVRSLRSEDAVRYAAGYFDPSRMVTNFAGVAVSNSDDKNEIIVRGNSPRGLLWRLEGVEIPNPNHFANGMGSTGGSYTAITTNVLSTFDFFTGSFPAEYGNALSGVMDLNLRNGNTEKPEYSAMLSVIGTELSAEGPIRTFPGSSYLADVRIADFSYLKTIGIYSEEDASIIPKTKDCILKANIRSSKTGTFSFFMVGGSSSVGDRVSPDKEAIGNDGDNDEYLEKRNLAFAGIRHLIDFSDNNSFIRSTFAYTREMTSDEDNSVDSLLRKTETYRDRFEYQAFRFASMYSRKFNSRNAFRAGISGNFIFGDMFARRLSTAMMHDTLVNDRGRGFYSGTWVQWKYKSPGNLETNSGMHITWSGITRELLFEPRFGLSLRLSDRNSFNAGTGVHSRRDPLSIYHYRVKVSHESRTEANKDLKMSKAFHLTTGFNQFFNENLHLDVEGYFQYLFDIPIRDSPSGQYSILNSSEGLPDFKLANNGKGKNTGLEITLEKSFSDNFYFLTTASLFNSKYKAPDGYWYNTYYNSNYVFNLQAGKEIPMGRYRQNILGIRVRGLYRGGFRYTPVRISSSLKNKRVVYETWDTYDEQLPDFKRIDMGLTFRANKSRYAWIILCDVQNATGTRNILRKKFEYRNRSIVTSSSRSLGAIPIVSLRFEF